MKPTSAIVTFTVSNLAAGREDEQLNELFDRLGAVECPVGVSWDDVDWTVTQ